MPEICVRPLGLQAYPGVFDAMKQHINAAADTAPADIDTDSADTSPSNTDQIWTVQHPPVFTQGQAGKAEHLLLPGDIPVVQVDRGGQVTYHGPGQIVIYPLVSLKRVGLNVRELVTALEKTIVATLADFDIVAEARKGAPGVYVGEAKIASLGLRIRRGRSYHGLAFNAAMDLEPFGRINPCGYQGLQMTQLADLLPADEMPELAEIEARLLTHLANYLGYTGWYYNQTSESGVLHGKQ